MLNNKHHQKGGRGSGCILRCSQPRTGLIRKKNSADERLFEQLSDKNDGKHVVILDARPKANAVANQARGGGSEVMSHYPNCKLEFCNVANIHVMRKDLQMLEESILSDDDGKWYQSVSGWLQHIGLLMDAAKRVTEEVVMGTVVLCHCSDGWDRTAQICALSQIALDPYARTIEGFMNLLEREWVVYGHKFGVRLGINSNDKEQNSPIFLQFLDATHQLMLQQPNAFEYNIQLLVETMDAALNCRFTTFLGNNEKEREEQKLRGMSFYSFILSHSNKYLNPLYQKTEDTLKIATSSKRLRLWNEFFLRYLID